jgi:hypothetical protein
MTEDDAILDDLFHGCALAAWLHQAAEQQGWPDSEATRERAYGYYEEALAAKHPGRSKADPEGSPLPPLPATEGHHLAIDRIIL